MVLLSENDDWSRSRNVFCRWSRMSAGRLAPENRNDGKPGAAAASGGTSMPSVLRDVPGDEVALPVARVGAVAAAELVDHRARPDARPADGERRGLRLAIEQAEVGQPGAAVAAGALERERVGIARLPAEAREQRVAAGQLVIDAHVGAVAVAVERQDLADTRRSRRSTVFGWFGSG